MGWLQCAGRSWGGSPAAPGRFGRDRRKNSEPESDEDPASVLGLLEAIGEGDPAEIFRRAVEKDVSELIARSRRLRADLDLTPEVADRVLAEALADAARRGYPAGPGSGRKPSGT